MFDEEFEPGDIKSVDQEALFTDREFAILKVLITKLYPNGAVKEEFDGHRKR
jgi:hypothetical protein